MATCSIKNVVCTFDLGRTINCAVVASCFGARYDNKVFPALVSNCMETNTSAQFFATGRVVIVGCRTEETGLEAAHRLVLALWKRCGIDGSMLNFSVRNIVVALSLGFEVDLDKMREESGDWPGMVLENARGEGGSAYDPARFSGMSFAMTDPMCSQHTITFAIFETGNGIATGLKHKGQLESVLEILSRFDRYECTPEQTCEREQERALRDKVVAARIKRVKQ